MAAEAVAQEPVVPEAAAGPVSVVSPETMVPAEPEVMAAQDPVQVADVPGDRAAEAKTDQQATEAQEVQEPVPKEVLAVLQIRQDRTEVTREVKPMETLLKMKMFFSDPAAEEAVEYPPVQVQPEEVAHQTAVPEEEAGPVAVTEAAEAVPIRTVSEADPHLPMPPEAVVVGPEAELSFSELLNLLQSQEQ